MFKIKKQQIDNMVAVFQQAFIEKIANHLDEVRRAVFPERDIAFDTHEARERLGAEVLYVLRYGLSSDLDVAVAIELFELYAVDVSSPKTRQIVEHEGLSASEKLERLWRLGAGVEPG
jgi:hypothetical protein